MTDSIGVFMLVDYVTGMISAVEQQCFDDSICLSNVNVAAVGINPHI